MSGSGEIRTSGAARTGIQRFLRTPQGVIASVIMAVTVLGALLSLVWLPADPNYASAAAIWQGPSAAHPLGTDGSGRDIAARLMAGSRVSLMVALASAMIAGLIGVLLGLAGGLTPRAVRESVAVAIDVAVAFPTILLTIMLAAVFGSGLPIVIVALGIAFGVSIGRVLRAELHQVAREDYVLAARAAGLSRGTILWRHLLPGVRPVFIVQLSLCMGVAVLAEASLSYLGFGAPPSVPSWGRMLAEMQRHISVHPESVLWPGLAITLLVLAFFLLGDALRDTLERGRQSTATIEVPR